MQAVIFDMDGTLIDSEPLWKEAEKQVFSDIGVTVTAELADQTASMTTSEVTKFWYRHSPWSGKSLEQVENEVIDRVEHLINQNALPMQGVNGILDFFQHKQFKIGLATNAPFRLIEVVLDKLDITHYFNAICSSEHEVKGKPHPAVYLSTLRKLHVDATSCIAFEDSLSGIKAAQQAKIKTVAVPASGEFEDEKFQRSHLKLRRLSDFTDIHLKNISGGNN
ncbi:MAG: HAD family hydrolase [Gammaproteobacteria bacterium]|nr:MAG: HAD family hydrolase [Gammaproteobacteria bacterium]